MVQRGNVPPLLIIVDRLVVLPCCFTYRFYSTFIINPFCHSSRGSAVKHLRAHAIRSQRNSLKLDATSRCTHASSTETQCWRQITATRSRMLFVTRKYYLHMGLQLQINLALTLAQDNTLLTHIIIPRCTNGIFVCREMTHHYELNVAHGAYHDVQNYSQPAVYTDSIHLNR